MTGIERFRILSGYSGRSGTRGRTYLDVQPGNANVAPRAPQSLRSVIKYD